MFQNTHEISKIYIKTLRTGSQALNTHKLIKEFYIINCKI